MNENLASVLQPPSLRTMVKGLLPSILVNGVLVFVIYLLVKHVTSASDLVALVISAIPAMLYTILSLIRQGQVDILGAFALITIAFSILLTFFSGDAKLFQIRESLLTILFGLFCLVSLLFPKPLWFYIIRYFTAGNKPEQIATFNTAWQYPRFRTYIRHITIFWGLIYVIEFVIRLVLVYSLPIAQFLLISPFIFYGITIAAIAFTLAYGRRLRKRADRRLPRQQMELKEPPTPGPQF
jgi:hypothetical protein